MNGAPDSSATSVYDALAKLVTEALDAQDDRRNEFRIPFVRQLTLAYPNGASACRHAFTRDLTPRGIGLLHSDAFTGKTLQALIPLEDGEDLLMTVQVVWSATLADGWFVSGAAFVDEQGNPI